MCLQKNDPPNPLADLPTIFRAGTWYSKGESRRREAQSYFLENLHLLEKTHTQYQ